MITLHTASWILPACLFLAGPVLLPNAGIQDPTTETRKALSAEQTRQAEAWIRDLGSERFETREAARKNLFELGPEALPLLDAAAQSDDPEVRWNARKLVRDLQRVRDEKREETKERAVDPPQEGKQDESRSKLRKAGSGTTSEPRVLDFGPGFRDGASTQRSQSMTVGPDGRVRVEVQETIDGKVEKRTYEAESMEELREKHPDLFQGMDIRIGGTRGFGFGVPGRELPGFDSKEWEKIFEGLPGIDPDLLRPHFFGGRDMDEMRRRVEEIEKRFRDLPGVKTPGLEWGNPPSVEAVPEVVPESERLGVMVQPVHEEVARFLGIEAGTGLVVEEVLEGSLAAELGLRARDVLVSINGRPITSTAVIRQVLRDTAAGAPIEVETLRVAGDRVKVSGQRPAAGSKSAESAEGEAKKDASTGTLRRDR